MGGNTAFRQGDLVVPAKPAGRVVCESVSAGQRFVRWIAVNHIALASQRQRAAVTGVHEYAVVRQRAERLNLGCREIRIRALVPADVKFPRPVVPDQPVEAMTVQIQESGGALRPAQQLLVEIISNIGITGGGFLGGEQQAGMLQYCMRCHSQHLIEMDQVGVHVRQQEACMLIGVNEHRTATHKRLYQAQPGGDQAINIRQLMVFATSPFQERTLPGARCWRNSFYRRDRHQLSPT